MTRPWGGRRLEIRCSFCDQRQKVLQAVYRTSGKRCESCGSVLHADGDREKPWTYSDFKRGVAPWPRAFFCLDQIKTGIQCDRSCQKCTRLESLEEGGGTEA